MNIVLADEIDYLKSRVNYLKTIKTERVSFEEAFTIKRGHLCVEYSKDNTSLDRCVLCPVYKYTGYNDCINTPSSNITSLFNKKDRTANTIDLIKELENCVVFLVDIFVKTI